MSITSIAVKIRCVVIAVSYLADVAAVDAIIGRFFAAEGTSGRTER
jgi:hypothetical protein